MVASAITSTAAPLSTRESSSPAENVAVSVAMSRSIGAAAPAALCTIGAGQVSGHHPRRGSPR
jgi:hypothetical protein